MARRPTSPLIELPPAVLLLLFATFPSAAHAHGQEFVFAFVFGVAALVGFAGGFISSYLALSAKKAFAIVFGLAVASFAFVDALLSLRTGGLTLISIAGDTAFVALAGLLPGFACFVVGRWLGRSIAEA
jgi:hypothetical protein